MAYSGAFVFGDSLVDAGNALKLAQYYGTLTLSDLPDGAPSADRGYFAGRFSNGYTFSDLIANKEVGQVTKTIFPYAFEDPWLGVRIAPWVGDPSGNTLNFAYGGAQVRQGDEVVPDLDGQTDAFKDAVDNRADSGALYIVTMGGNDVRSLAPSGSDPVPVAEAHAALDEVAQQMVHELGQLIGIGVRNLLITGIPDVGLIPKYDRDASLALDPTEQARASSATAYSAYLDTLLRNQVIPALEAKGASVTYVPLMDYTDAAGNRVTGALNANLATIATLNGLPPTALSDNLLAHQQTLFFDQIHPNAMAHGLVTAFALAKLHGTPWVETLPLAGNLIGYASPGSIGAAGEVDRLSVSLVAGSTYTLEMLGVSALGTMGSLADPRLKLVTSAGSTAASDEDSGAGLDARISFTATSSGLYTLELSSSGAPTGNYAVQAALTGGAALLAGNNYSVSSASTIILEAAGGLGQDVVRASVSYALLPGAEIEVLRTSNDKGKTAINLTGNAFDQALVGNAGANVLDGREGADRYTGGAGNDVFMLGAGSGPGQIDAILDYARGDLVDMAQVLSVAAGTNVAAGGYVRVTSSGLVQVDADGGGDAWQTLASINGSGAVDVRFLAGGALTTATLARVAEASALMASDAGSAMPMPTSHDWLFT